jgi:hypothetical protein
MEATLPKVYLCSDMVSCDGGKSFDVISGGSNGTAYLWRRGCLTASTSVCRGPLTSLQVMGAKVFCGGAGGIVKILDVRTLGTLKSFNVSAAVTRDLHERRPITTETAQLNRARSAPRMRTASSGNLSTAGVSKANASELSKAADTTVTCLTVAEDRRSVKGSRLSIIATTAAGVAIRVEEDADDEAIIPLFYYHTGAVNGLSRFGN